MEILVTDSDLEQRLANIFAKGQTVNIWGIVGYAFYFTATITHKLVQMVRAQVAVGVV